MDQFRLLIAIGLSFLVFMVWGHFFNEKKPATPPPEQQSAQQQTTGAEKTSAPYVKQAAPATPPAIAALAPAPAGQTARSVTVDTPLYVATLSENGAVFTSFALKNYREAVDVNAAPKELIPEDLSSGTIRLGFKEKSLPGIQNAIFSADTVADHIDVGNNAREITFSWQSPQGVLIEKTYRFSPENYQIDLSVTVKNGSNQPFKDNLQLSLFSQTDGATGRYGFTGPSALIDKKLQKIKIKKIKENPVHAGNLEWVAVQDRYFLSGLIPKTATQAAMHLSLDTAGKLLETRYIHPESLIPEGTQQTVDFLLYLGPKSIKILESVNYNLDKAIDFGWFDFIAKPCVWLMNFLYGFVPNFGLVIIILTIMIKILLWPLGNKSYKSMNEMKKLQPLMTEIREKHKGDKQKMNQEVMALYRTYKINPMSGCLPMVAQIPVFIAFYRMLYEAIELRHAPFFGWINDLSAPDRLFHFDLTIPLMEAPYGIPVLTIIMGASMLLQQKMTPAAGDPMQQKMMMLMPVVFTFIFINFPSGLVLYWLTNNLLSIAQQYYVTKKAA